MGILIDTNVLIRAERGQELPETLIRQSPDELIFIAAITASELLHGIHRANSSARRERRREFVENILQAVNILPFDLEVARVHARIWADLMSRGQLIGAHDLLIAATALTHDLELATGNEREFVRVDGLVLLR